MKTVAVPILGAIFLGAFLLSGCGGSADVTAGESQLSDMLQTARSVDATDDRDRALRIVVDTAVERGTHGTAITVVFYIHALSNKTSAYISIAQSAVAARLFDVANLAANKIPNKFSRDQMKIEILEARQLTST